MNDDHVLAPAMAAAVLMYLAACSPGAGADAWAPTADTRRLDSVPSPDSADLDSTASLDSDGAVESGPLPSCENLEEEFREFVERNNECTRETRWKCRSIIASPDWCSTRKSLGFAMVHGEAALRRARAYESKYRDCPNAETRFLPYVDVPFCRDGECHASTGRYCEGPDTDSGAGRDASGDVERSSVDSATDVKADR